MENRGPFVERLKYVLSHPKTAPILLHVAILLDIICFFIPFFKQETYNFYVTVYDNMRFGGLSIVINGIPFICIIVLTIEMLVALWKPTAIKPRTSKILGSLTIFAGN